MNKTDKKAFKQELKALLNKYDAMIIFDCASSSDLHGVYDAHIKIVNKECDTIISNSGYSLSKFDIKLK